MTKTTMIQELANKGTTICGANRMLKADVERYYIARMKEEENMKATKNTTATANIQTENKEEKNMTKKAEQEKKAQERKAAAEKKAAEKKAEQEAKAKARAERPVANDQMIIACDLIEELGYVLQATDNDLNVKHRFRIAAPNGKKQFRFDFSGKAVCTVKGTIKFEGAEFYEGKAHPYIRKNTPITKDAIAAILQALTDEVEAEAARQAEKEAAKKAKAEAVAE